MNAFEIEIINQIREAITPFFDKVLEFITILGEQTILILLLLIIYFIISKREGQIIAFSVFTTLLLNNAIKICIQRIRPFDHPNRKFEASRIETATGYSFPSGHTQNAAATYTAVGLSFKKRWLWILVIILITLIGFSRVGLGVHYPSDVIVGAALGIGSAFLGRFLFVKTEKCFKKQILLYSITALLFLPFAIIFLNKFIGNPEKFKDFFTTYAFFLGYLAAVILERKYVNFNCNTSLKTKLIRTAIALVIVVGIQFGLKPVLPDTTLFAAIRYFLLAFVTLGVYPLVAKKWLFSN